VDTLSLYFAPGELSTPFDLTGIKNFDAEETGEKSLAKILFAPNSHVRLYKLGLMVNSDLIEPNLTWHLYVNGYKHPVYGDMVINPCDFENGKMAELILSEKNVSSLELKAEMKSPGPLADAELKARLQGWSTPLAVL